MPNLISLLGVSGTITVGGGGSAPTFVDYQNSNFGDAGTTDEVTASMSWINGDRFYVFGAVSNDDNGGDTLATPAVGGLSGSNLTWSSLATVNTATVGGGSGCRCYLWRGLATGTGSGTIGSVTGTSATTLRSGIAVIQVRGATGEGTPVTVDDATAKTFNLTRTAANSVVICGLADWAQANDVAVTASPGDGTVRLASAQAAQADFFFITWPDQGGTGTTAYGLANHTGTVDFAGFVLEITI